MASYISLFLPSLALFSLALAQGPPAEPKGSTFVYEGKEVDFGPPSHRQSSDPRVVFALNAESSSGDLYFHLESPKDNSWVGVGIGSSMAEALFLIAYPSSNGTGVTISGRSATGESEPSALDGITIDKIYDEGLTDANTVTGGGAGDDDEGSIIVDAVCRKCASFGNGVASIDFKSTEQPFIFAVGPPLRLESDSVDAGLQEHIIYGHFTMDMTASTSDSSASVPEGPYTMASSTKLGSVSEDHDPGSRIHGIVMSVVFIIVLPLGALLLRVCNVKVHIIIQLIGWILFMMAFAGGAVASKKYNKSKNFASGHQVLGILLLIALLSQWVLGWMNHRTFKKMGHGTILGKIHLYLGPVIIFLGWVNGALGFRFASQPFLSIPYAILIIVMIIFYAIVRTLIMRRRRNQAKAGRAPPGMPAFGSAGGAPLAQQQGYYHPTGSTSDLPNDAPPAYNQGIHLQQYPSTQSLPQAGPGQAPVQPRNMV